MELSRTIETETGEMIVKRVSVPLGLEELMEGLAKEVILKKPKDIYVFASEYFTKLLHLRDSGLYRGNVRSAKLAVKQPSKAVIVGRNIFSPLNPDYSSNKNIERKPSTPYYLNHSEGSAKKTDEMRRSRIREHLRMKKEEYGQGGNTTETHSSIKKSNSVTISKDMKLMHKSRPVTRNRRSISENEAKHEEKSYERTGSLGEGTKMNSKTRDISSSIQKNHKNDSSVRKTNPEDFALKSSRKKSFTNVPTDTAQKESLRSVKILKNASLEVAQNTELIAKVITSIDSDNSNNKAGNISSIQDEKGHYEVSYNPELLASDREDKPDSTSYLSFKKDSEITENNEGNGSINTNEEQQKPLEEKLGNIETELKHENRDYGSDLIEHQDFLPVNESSELEAALTIQKLWRGFQSRKKTNHSQQNTSSTNEEDERTNCVSQQLQNCKISEEQTITLDDEIVQDISEEFEEEKNKETHNSSSVTLETSEEDNQKKQIQNEELHCVTKEKEGKDEIENQNEDLSSVKDPIKSDTKKEVSLGESSELDKSHENKYREAEEEGKEDSSSSEDQVSKAKETESNLDTSEQTNVNKNEENEKSSSHQQPVEEHNTSAEIIGEHVTTPCEKEGLYSTIIVTDPNKDMESSPLIRDGNSDGEHYLKPEEGEEPSSTLLNVSQDEISEIDSKNRHTNEVAIHDQNEDEDGGMKHQKSTSSEKHSEETLPTTSSDTVHSLDNTHGSHSVSEGSDETEISDRSVIENNTNDTSNVTGLNRLNSHVVNEDNQISTRHIEDGSKCVELPNGNEDIRSNEIDFHGTDVNETTSKEKSSSINEIGKFNGPDIESKNGDELLSTLSKISQEAPAEAEIPKSNVISLEHSDDKSKKETEKDEQNSSTHIEDSSLEGFDENPHDVENYVVDTQQNESAPIEANENKNWNESFLKENKDVTNSEKYAKSITEANPISSNSTLAEDVHSNSSSNNETEQQNHKSIEEFTNELKANEENNITDAQELPKLKDGHEQSTTLSNSFQDAASDINESRKSGDNSVKNSEENGFSPAHNLVDSTKNIAACTSAIHELNEVENLGNSLFEKKGDTISDSISSIMLVVTSNDSSNSVHKNIVTISDQTEDNANVNEFHVAKKNILLPNNSTEDHEHSKPKEHQSDQQHEDNSLETTEEAPENERPPFDNSTSRGKNIDSQNELDNKSINMEKEDHETVENEMDSTDPKADLTNDDIPKVIEVNEIEEEPNVILSQKDNQVDVKEDYAENLNELNVHMTSVEGEDDNEPKKENSNQPEESTIRSELDPNNTANYNQMSQIISTRSRETRLTRPDKKISNETDDNFRSFGKSTNLSLKDLQIHQKKSDKENKMNTEDSSKIKSKIKFNKKRSYSHRPETEQQEKSRNSKTNIRRVKSQETTTFRNQNKARRNSVSPVKHLSQKVSKNSIIDTVSHEAVNEPLAIRKNIVPNQSIQDDMKSAVDDVTSTTDERIESEITPTDFAGEKLETSNVQMEANNDIDQSEKENFITEDNKDSSEKYSDNNLDDAASESSIRKDKNHDDHELKLEENDEFSKEINIKTENEISKKMNDSNMKDINVLDEEMQKDIPETNEIVIENNAPNEMAEENSDNRRIGAEDKNENDLRLMLNNTDIHQEDKIEESQFSTTPSNSIELISGEDHSSDLYPETKGSPSDEHVSEKENYKAVALAKRNAQDDDESASSSEIETNLQHEKVEKLEDEMTGKTEPSSTESEIKSNSIKATEIAKEDSNQQQINNTDIINLIESNQNADDKEENNDELNGENFGTLNKGHTEKLPKSNGLNDADLIEADEFKHESEESTTTEKIHPEETIVTPRQMQAEENGNQENNDAYYTLPPENNANPLVSKIIEDTLEDTMHQNKHSSQEFIENEKVESLETESTSNYENPENSGKHSSVKSMNTKNIELTRMKTMNDEIFRTENNEDVENSHKAQELAMNALHSCNSSSTEKINSENLEDFVPQTLIEGTDNHEKISQLLSSTDSISNLKLDSEKDVEKQSSKAESDIDETKENYCENLEQSEKLATRDDSLNNKNTTESESEVCEPSKQNLKQISLEKDETQETEDEKISPYDEMKNLDEIESAINIQKAWRGFQARKQLGNMLDNNKKQKLLELKEKLLEKSETDENRNILNSQDKNLLGTNEPSTNSNNSNTNENKTKDKNFNDADQDEITKAALKIQCSFRKIKTRKGKKFERSALQHMDNDTAKEYVNQALKIQSAWRAYKVRKNIREVEEKINEIENNSGNKLPKSIHLTDEEILKAVTKIQTNLRGYMARKHFKHLLERNQTLDGIQEETNSETPNVKTNITVSSDEDILNTLKQLDEVTIPCTSPEFVSEERIKRNVNKSDSTEVSSDLLDASNSAADTSTSNNSLNEINCSSSNVSEDTSNMNPNVIWNSKRSDEKSVNDKNSISIKSSNNISTHSNGSFEQNELDSKICDENESDIPRPVPVNILDTATSDLPNNETDQQIFNTEAQGSLKKSKATDDLVKLAEEFENGGDSSKAIDHTLKTQKSFEENDSTQVPDIKDYLLPDKKLASFEIPDSDVDLDDLSKVSIDHESDGTHSEKSDAEEVDAGDPKTTSIEDRDVDNTSPKTTVKWINRSTKSVEGSPQNFNKVDDFVKKETTDRLETSPLKASDEENSAKTVKESQTIHDQKQNEVYSNVVNISKEKNSKNEMSENNQIAQINSKTSKQFSLMDEKMPEGILTNIENEEALAQVTGGMKGEAILETKSEEIDKIDDSIVSIESMDAVHQEENQNESIDSSNKNQMEISAAIENHFMHSNELLTGTTDHTHLQEQTISDNQSEKSTTFEEKESDKNNKQIESGNQKNSRLTLNDFMKKTLNLDQKFPAEKEAIKNDLNLNQKLPDEEKFAKNENAQIKIDLNESNNSTEVIGKDTKIQNEAAVKIQSVYRGYISRKKTNNLTKDSDDSGVINTEFQTEKDADNQEQQHSEENSATVESPSAQQTTGVEGGFTKTDHPLYRNSTGDETPEKSSSVAVGIQTNVPSNTDSNTDEEQDNVPGQVFVIIAGIHGIWDTDGSLSIFRSLLYVKENYSNLVKLSSSHEYDTRNSQVLLLPHHRTSKYESSPMYKGVKFFNHLPDSVKCSQKTEFRNVVKLKLIKKCYYSIGEHFNDCKF